MACTASGRLVKEDYVKKLVKYEPSPIVTDSEGIGGVWEVGKFSDSAPKHLRRRRLYTAIFHATLQPSPSDPLTSLGALTVAWFQLLGMCGPKDSTPSWSGCTDSLEQCGWANLVSTRANYSTCFIETSGTYAPYLLILLAQPASNTDLTAVSAYAKPCPVESSAPDLSGKSKIPVPLKLRAWGCTDATNKLVYNRYVTIDSSTNTYTIAGGGLGYTSSSQSIIYWMVYMLPSSTTKGSGDVFQYIYQVAAQYQ